MFREGPSNHEISERLLISERTAKAHVANLLEKLGLSSRLQLGLASLLFDIERSCPLCHDLSANSHEWSSPVEIETPG